MCKTLYNDCNLPSLNTFSGFLMDSSYTPEVKDFDDETSEEEYDVDGIEPDPSYSNNNNNNHSSSSPMSLTNNNYHHHHNNNNSKRDKSSSSSRYVVYAKSKFSSNYV